MRQKQRHCKTCGKATLFAKDTFSDGWGCLLTILTAGLFLPVWILLAVMDRVKPWRCQVCGGK